MSMASTAAAFQSVAGIVGLITSTHYASGGTRTSQLLSYDANGNIIAWTTATGSLLRKIDYDAFGTEVIVENFAPAAETEKLRTFGFSTKPKDPETGLSYYGYRYYDPGAGRWPSRDPIEENGGVNLYGFVGNNGVNRWDFLGLKDCDCIAIYVFYYYTNSMMIYEIHN